MSLLLSASLKPNVTYSVQLVTRATCKFDCHDGEVNAVKFHKNGKFFATGGGDRKIKLWEYKDSKADCFGSLIGSNASIASIDIDNEVRMRASDVNKIFVTRFLNFFKSNLIAGTSFDFACRLWSLTDTRLRVNIKELYYIQLFYSDFLNN